MYVGVLSEITDIWIKLSAISSQLAAQQIGLSGF
jgi:hypothetical protein